MQYIIEVRKQLAKDPAQELDDTSSVHLQSDVSYTSDQINRMIMSRHSLRKPKHFKFLKKSFGILISESIKF